ncbi:hypothetical protein KC963_02795 [Candidatus Saccharibacteria bacterium]|nr:hypothetical protein [Candidatus Saccharibacteria bacterium]
MDTLVLWENDQFIISSPKNPHLPYSEGVHVIISPKRKVANAWEDIDLSQATFKLASQVCRIMAKLDIAPWFNIQANGNWGLLPGSTPFFHVHVYGRNKTASWGKPLVLPEAPNTYHNEPVPEAGRVELMNAFEARLEK